MLERVAMVALVLALVNDLLTISIKVNILAAAESQFSRTGIQNEKERSSSLEFHIVDVWWRHDR
jgi:hypothetical protein